MRGSSSAARSAGPPTGGSASPASIPAGEKYSSSIPSRRSPRLTKRRRRVRPRGSRPGGPVERLGHRGTPVADDGRLILVPDPDPADVERLARTVGGAIGRRLRAGVAGSRIDAAEAQRATPQFQLPQALEHPVLENVPLEAGRMRATTPVGNALPELPHPPPGCLQAGAGTIHVGLFGLQLRLRSAAKARRGQGIHPSGPRLRGAFGQGARGHRPARECPACDVYSRAPSLDAHRAGRRHGNQAVRVPGHLGGSAGRSVRDRAPQRVGEPRRSRRDLQAAARRAGDRDREHRGRRWAPQPHPDVVRLRARQGADQRGRAPQEDRLDQGQPRGFADPRQSGGTRITGCR